MTLVTSSLSPVEADLRLLSENLIQLVGTRHPILSLAAAVLELGKAGATGNCPDLAATKGRRDYPPSPTISRDYRNDSRRI